MFTGNETIPIAILSLPVVLSFRAEFPIAIFELPVVLWYNA